MFFGQKLQEQVDILNHLIESEAPLNAASIVAYENARSKARMYAAIEGGVLGLFAVSGIVFVAKLYHHFQK